MSHTVIQVENLSKYYRLGMVGTGTLSHDLNRWWATLRGKPDPSLKIGKGKNDNGDGHIWALRDISFEVKQGDVLGIIGRNGAGKSTLLKILSRVTAPTSGECRVRGRIASLLEVGTGFHPELTGRENIFLNGAILGMTKEEIKQNFDAIVAFAEVEKFVDTPVKRYSSGMYVRLAFAVAAHLEPEILIIDEVLAVGDAQFQRKCLGKMGDIASQGRTVLFVSHNMAAIKTLCGRSVLLDGGYLRLDGESGNVVNAYLRVNEEQSSRRVWDDPEKAPGNEYVRMKSIGVSTGNGEPVITIDTGAVVKAAFYNYREGINLDFTVYLVNGEEILLCETGCIISRNYDSRLGRYHITGKIPPNLLNADNYKINILFGQDQRYPLFRMDNAVSFDVEHTATGRGSNMSRAPGVIRPILDWRADFVEDADLKELTYIPSKNCDE